MLVTVNIKMTFTFKHPKYYKELRKRNNELRAATRDLAGAQSDQAISKEPATAGNQRSPGPGLKLQAREDSTANSTRGQVAEPQASSDKPQAANDKPTEPQASSGKLQASSNKLQAPSHKRQAP